MKTTRHVAAWLFLWVMLPATFIFASPKTADAATIIGGWYKPTSTSDRAAGWLASGCNGSKSYIPGSYHTGIDFWRPVGSAVYAIGNGTVVAKQNWGSTYGNALFIRHKTAKGKRFIAVYGHVKSSLTVGNRVKFGAKIARIANISGPHLHFGIRPGKSVPNSNNGNMRCAKWRQTNGYVNPIAYLKSHPRTASLASKYKNTIVQWSGDKKPQKTAWLVGSDGRRRWIPSSRVYYCLKSKGIAGPKKLGTATLKKLPDRVGVKATCSRR